MCQSFFNVGEKKTINPTVRSLFNPSRSRDPPSLESLLAALYDSCPSSCAFQYALPQSTPAFCPEDDVNVDTVIECNTETLIPPSIISQGIKGFREILLLILLYHDDCILFVKDTFILMSV